MSTSPELDQRRANLKPQKVVVPKVWKRPHSTIYGKNVEFGNKLYSDKLGEINGRKFNSELPWQVRNSGPGSTSGSSSSQGYLSNLLNEPQSTLIGSVITPSGGRDSRGSAAVASRWYNQDINGHGQGHEDESASSSALDKYCDRKSKLTPGSCSNYADVLELTNPNRYSKRRSEKEQEAARIRRANNNNLGLPSSMLHDVDNQQNNIYYKTTTTTPIKPRRIDFYDNYLEFSNEISRMNESSRLANDPLLQRRVFDNSMDFNYELGLFVPSATSSGGATSAGSGSIRRMIFDDDGRSLLRKKTNQWQPDEPTARHPFSTRDDINYCYDAKPCTRPHSPYDNPADHQHHNKDITNYQSNYFNPVVTTTKQTHLLPKHACQLADSPYGHSADGRKLSLGSINPHSYRPSLPQRTSTVHASDGEEFEFQDRSSPFYTDRWAGRTIRHFDSDLYSNASLFKSMIL